MVKTIIFLTPYYLNFASKKAFEVIEQNIRLVLIHDKNSELEKDLSLYWSRICSIDANEGENLRPILNYDDCSRIISEEIDLVKGIATDIRIFCQEECHVLMAATLRKQFAIPGDCVEMIENFRDKVKMKMALMQSNIRVPKYKLLEKERLINNTQNYYYELENVLSTPIVIKPINSAGSFEVSIVNNLSDFNQVKALVINSKYNFGYEVDEFIDGVMYQCDSLVIDGKVKFCGALELGCTNFDFVLGQPLSVFPLLPEELRLRLEKFNQDVITALKFQNGSTHHELFFNQQTDELIFLEIAARVPGGIGIPFHEKNSGINLIDANLYLTCENKKMLDEIQPYSHHNVVSALLPLKKGKITKLNTPNIISKYDIKWAVQPGMTVDSHSLVDVAGILTLYNNDKKQLRKDFEALQNYVPVSVE